MTSSFRSINFKDPCILKVINESDFDVTIMYIKRLNRWFIWEDSNEEVFEQVCELLKPYFQ